MHARDIMTRDVVTVSPQATVREIAELLLGRRISAVPVVETDGRLCGVVSEGDLMRRPESGTEARHSWWLDLFASADESADAYVKAHGRTAGDVMTRDVVTVAPDATLGDVAGLLERRHIKRVPVVDGTRLVGIVSRADLLRALASAPTVHPAPVPAGDAEVRERVLAALRADGLPGTAWINPIVSDGVVHLWGLADSERQRDAVRVAAETAEGVRSVLSHVGIRPASAYSGV